VYENILYDVADGVATITLNQPDKRNALSHPMLDDLVAAFGAAKDDPEVRVAVLTGAGDVFSAGGDLSGFSADLPLAHKHYGTTRFLDLFRAIAELGKPTICKANGHVVAGGLGVALACDLIVASDAAKFSTPEINIGLFPFMIMAIIYRNVPRKKVNEMMLLGERLSAEQAVGYGLANKVVPAGEFDAAVAEWATKLASKSPVLMRLGHDAMYRQQDMAVDDALEYLRSQLSLTFSTEDIVEGVTAFFEKRDPQWKGR
jgi:enoyl-CoA hydratase/carnithine racemase